jgi:hypothetical protein
MFDHLTQLNKVRTPKEAIGFYIVYLLGFFAVGASMGLIANAALSGDSEAIQGYITLVNVVVVVIVSGLATFIWHKKQLNDIIDHAAVIATALLTLFGTIILGLIPVAFLTTRQKREQNG